MHLSWKGLKNGAVDGRMALQSFFCTEDWRFTGCLGKVALYFEVWRNPCDFFAIKETSPT